MMGPDAPPWDLDAIDIERRPNPWPQMSTIVCTPGAPTHTYGDAALNAVLTRAALEMRLAALA